VTSFQEDSFRTTFYVTTRYDSTPHETTPYGATLYEITPYDATLYETTPSQNGREKVRSDTAQCPSLRTAQSV